MAEMFDNSLQQLAAKVGDFSEDAYHFVREGLGYAVTRTHGPESTAQITVFRFLMKNKLDLDDLADLCERGELSGTIKAAVDEAGGVANLNRHVTGGEMCWGLREFALHRWGKLARRVLDSWNVRCTLDFGRIVFSMIEHEFMQKQPSDSIDDFNDVFDFEEAFDRSYDIAFDEH